MREIMLTTLELKKKSIDGHFKRNIRAVFNELYPVKVEYPNFHRWYCEKVVPGIFEGSRIIIVKFVSGEIAGVSILKTGPVEKKICTLRISEAFRGKGIGSELIEQSFYELDCNEPLITVSSPHLTEFDGVLENNNFKLYRIYPSYYTKDVDEYSFNGYLYTKDGTDANH
jgi:GNAT superfamily N-acetyltransferase